MKHSCLYRLFLTFILFFAFMATISCNSAITESPADFQLKAIQPTAQSTTASSIVSVALAVSPIKRPAGIMKSPLATPMPYPTPIIATAEATARVPMSITVDGIERLQPQADSALITGRLIDEATGMPAPFIYVYLSGVIGPDNKPIIALDRGKALLSISNENGIFYFDRVLPGKYGIVVWSPVGSYLLKEPETDFSLLIEVVNGQTIHLGDLISFIP